MPAPLTLRPHSNPFNVLTPPLNPPPLAVHDGKRVRIMIVAHREGIRDLSKVAEGWRISNTPYCCVGTFRYSKGGLYPAPGSHAHLAAAADAFSDALARTSEDMSIAQTLTSAETTAVATTASETRTRPEHVTSAAEVEGDAATSRALPRWKTIQLLDLVPFTIEDLEIDKDSACSGFLCVSVSVGRVTENVEGID